MVRKKAVKNTVFVALVLALLFSAAGLRTLQQVIPGFPVETESQAEGRAFLTAADLEGKSFATGEFQDEFEQFSADSIPRKDDVLVFSAGLQRASIGLAAAPFSYDVYPTFYSSEYCAYPAHNMIVSLPTKAPGENSASSKNLTAWAKTLNAAKAAHPEVNFVADIVLQVRQDDSNPTYGLVKYNRMNAEWVHAAWRTRLSDDITLIVDDIASRDEVFEEWFADDHHWQLSRALRSYSKIGDVLGWHPYEWSDEDCFAVRDVWYGSYARRGLDFEHGSSLLDLPTDFSSLTFKSFTNKGVGKRIELGKREAFLRGDVDSSDVGLYNAYSDYFGNDPMLVENAALPNGKTCIVVGDSMTYNLRRYIASNYKNTLFVLPGNTKTSQSLDSLIREFSADDVVILTHASSPDFIADKSPAFLKGK